MEEQRTQNTFKKLKDRKVLPLSSTSGTCIFIFGIPFFIVGVYLMHLADGNMDSILFLPSITFLLFPIILLLPIYFPAYKNKDYFIKEYNPFKQARKYLIRSVIRIVFLFCFLTPFVVIVFEKPVSLFTPVTLIFVVVSILGSLAMTIEYIKLMLNGIKHGRSKIQLLEQPLFLGGQLKVRFENQSSNITGKRLQASLRNISEIMEYTSKEDSSKSAVVYQRYEKVIPFVMELSLIHI